MTVSQTMSLSSTPQFPEKQKTFMSELKNAVSLPMDRSMSSDSFPPRLVRSNEFHRTTLTTTHIEGITITEESIREPSYFHQRNSPSGLQRFLDMLVVNSNSEP